MEWRRWRGRGCATSRRTPNRLCQEVGDLCALNNVHKCRSMAGVGELWFFPVSNRLGHADPVLVDVMKTMARVALAEDYINKEVRLCCCCCCCAVMLILCCCVVA